MAYYNTAKKPKLSKGILEMKFMQKTKTKLDTEEDDAEGRAMYATEINNKLLNRHVNFVTEPSYMVCEGLNEVGRFSFRGMNPEIERITEVERAEKNPNKREEVFNGQKEDVSIEEMRKYFPTSEKTNSLNRTIAKKFGKRKNMSPVLEVNGRDESPENSKYTIVHKNDTKKVMVVDKTPKMMSRKFLKPKEYET